MKGNFFLKDKKVTLTVGVQGQVPTITLELNSPQFIIDGEKVTVIEGEVNPSVKK